MDTWNTNTNDPLSSDERYQAAYRKVKKIKGFYTHAVVYVLVNLFLIFRHIDFGTFDAAKFWQFHTFSTAIFWGIGLLVHAITVFGPLVMFTSDWEERKIKVFMDKESKQKWQ